MRRILAVVTLGAALFTAAACADTKPDASASPSAATATSAAAGVDKKTACTNLKAAVDGFSAKAIVLAPKLADPDKAKAGAAVSELLTELQAFQTKYSADIAAIQDPELKAAVQDDIKVLTTASAAVLAAGTDAAKVNTVLSGPEFQKAGEKVKSLCGF
jgi:hypothetical protein